VLNGTKTLFCQLRLRRVRLLKPTIILGKTGACKNGTGNNGTNGKLGRNGTLMLNFSKLKPQTLHRKPPPLEHPPPDSNHHPKLQNPKYKPKILTSNPSFKLQTPPQN